jgi:hypothetical protein
MADDADPPRKFYQLKPRAFEQVNEMPPPAVPAPNSAAGVPPPAAAPAPIDVRDLARQAMTSAPLLAGNPPGNRENDVHAMLRGNLARDEAAGLYHVPATVDKKRRARVRRFWIALIVFDGTCGAIAWVLGPSMAIPFVCALGGAGAFTALLIWHTWFLRTD